MKTGVAGLFPVACKKVNNVDLSSIITGHREYSEKLTEILQFLEIKTKERSNNNLMKKSASDMPCIKNTRLKKVCYHFLSHLI